MTVESKLPDVGTNIFSVMSTLAEEHGAINLSQGFPNYDTPDALKNLVNHYVQKGFNQYAPMPGVPILRGRLAEKIEKSYGRAVDPATEITITAGGTQAIFTAISAFIRVGDEVILIEPAYDCYAPSVEVCGGVVVPYRLEAPDFEIDWEKFARLVSPKTKMIIVNTPHNPTGKTLKTNDLRQLEQITEGSDILILSDEVYEHLIFDGQLHESVLRYPNLAKRSLSVFSFGKTFHATGWKMGYIVATEILMREFRKVHQFNVFSVNTPAQFAIADYLADENTYLSLPDFYQSKRDYFLKLMHGSRLKPLACEGTYFQLFDYQEVSEENDFDFAKRLIAEFGVASIPVSVFYSKKKVQKAQNAPNTEGVSAKVIRLCFAKTDETLEQAAERLRKI